MTTILSSCSSDNDNLPEGVTYDKTKGYLTTIESVQHGIIGTWKAFLEIHIIVGGTSKQLCTDSYRTIKFDKNNKFILETVATCTEQDINDFNEAWLPPLISSGTSEGEYSIIDGGNKFILTLKYYRPDGSISSTVNHEIFTLNKTTFKDSGFIYSDIYTRQ